MKIQRIIKKYAFYLTWYSEMNSEQLNSFIGQWVRERIDIFGNLLKEFENKNE